MTDVRTHLSACFCSATTCMCTFGCYVPAHPKPHHSYATPHPAESIEKRITRLPTHTVPLCSMHCRRSQPKITCLAFLHFAPASPVKRRSHIKPMLLDVVRHSPKTIADAKSEMPTQTVALSAQNRQNRVSVKKCVKRDLCITRPSFDRFTSTKDSWVVPNTHLNRWAP